ncbi:GH92 family glycosyl hydrolase [Novacetimonas pomaceti]|uniref:Alpha-1 2-mannosidase n=1 Tax=Novacetimonas pomaceti TaxID=2021998 RepID=A0ABX5P715_9PROT|nr:GH92 family glycosyl hydrolase [Novacetimonas pomaceti]PYD47713.1 alpha-1 2-mannosidase [Novacetimonas pomaceti]
MPSPRLVPTRVLMAAALISLPVCSAMAGPGDFTELFDTGTALPARHVAGLDTTITNGPDRAEALTAHAGSGFTGLHALRYDVEHPDGRTRSVILRPVHLPIGADARLSYMVFPVADPASLTDPATFVSLDLVFADGTTLSGRGARDWQGISLSPLAQGKGNALYPNQWNRVFVDIGRLAAGRTVTAIVLRTAPQAGTAPCHGYVDDIRIDAASGDNAAADPADLVDTRRGTNANGHFSRGNNFPAVAMPHGFNFWTPVTNAGSKWLYQYQERNGPDNRPRIEAFSLSHEPSPWMGDRQTFQIMPALAGAVVLDREKRALGFVHEDEVARPYWYRVNLDHGITGEMTPTSHAAMMRFTFPATRGQLVFDNLKDQGGIRLHPDRRSLDAYSDVASDLSTGATRMYIHVEFDRPVIASGRIKGQGRDHVAAWMRFDTRTDRRVNLRIATSLISAEQARRNMRLELSDADTFESVRERARVAWDDLLRRVSLPDAPVHDRAVLYGNLYRLFLYPNELAENVGTAARPDYRYASPFSPRRHSDGPRRTGAPVHAGQPYVNNGFWDTYRAAWPAYVLLTPDDAGRMIDGFVQQYREAGWIARWSSPGYADLMTGTSADIAFADAWLKGVRNFDVHAFYQAALKDGTVVPDQAGVGRKALGRTIFRGYTDTATEEGLSWSSAANLNDFGIGALARAMADQSPQGDTHGAQYAADARYFLNRSRNYLNLFDRDAGFFVGRNPDGHWRTDAAHFDPIAWGGDYTETNAWNMAFDPVHDGAGLAALYGGRAGLARKLDELFRTPGAYHVGAYGSVIHEMRELHDVRMGQYGHGNQPAHHILYMYDVAGQPWKAQDHLREAMDRLYEGTEIGQGYPGDEDNGEMSAWWLFSAAGFYPLQMGTATYAIGAPHFSRMVIALGGGRSLTILAPGVSDQNRYIQSVRLNGHPIDRTWISHADIMAGGVLEFTMGPRPSRWGTAVSAAPPSLTPYEGTAPAPLRDATDMPGADNGTAPAALSDNDSDTDAMIPAQGITTRLPEPHRVMLYTLTSAKVAKADPATWRVEGSDDGTHWDVVDRRAGESFAWRQQTRVFAISRPGNYRAYRLVPEKGRTRLAEIEWLAEGVPQTLP